jgi:hypothetical protein
MGGPLLLGRGTLEVRVLDKPTFNMWHDYGSDGRWQRVLAAIVARRCLRWFDKQAGDRITRYAEAFGGGTLRMPLQQHVVTNIVSYGHVIHS